MSPEQGLAAGTNPVNQICRQVIGISCTAAISAKEKISPATPTSLQGGSSPSEGSHGETREKPLHGVSVFQKSRAEAYF